jgi:dihydroorotate dehydrogenase subfamily 2
MSTKYTIIGSLYRTVLKPIAFLFDAELIHNLFTSVGELLERFPWAVSLFAYTDSKKKLRKKVLGVWFDNPIGLAAGFDYDGHLAQVLKYVGFGFNTVGSVTARAYEGNTKPRLGRLPKSRSLLVNKGFKSEGADRIAQRLDTKKLKNNTVGISVGSTNSPKVNTIDKAIADYVYTFTVFKKRSYIKYFELNISCPNTSMTESFINPVSFKKLVQVVAKLKLKQPIFVKMPNEISLKESDALVEIALSHGISGFIFSNLVKKRDNPAFDPAEMQKMAQYKGNFSGKPAEANANALVAHTRKKFGKKVAIIGCGGVFSAEDAQKKLQCGADLVQFITGMIFQGPQLAGEICEELAER